VAEKLVAAEQAQFRTASANLFRSKNKQWTMLPQKPVPRFSREDLKLLASGFHEHGVLVPCAVFGSRVHTLGELEHADAELFSTIRSWRSQLRARTGDRIMVLLKKTDVAKLLGVSIWFVENRFKGWQSFWVSPL